MEHHPSPSNKRRVAFVELPDEGLEILSHYTQSADWEVVLIVDPDPESYAVRMAQVLGILVQTDPDLEKLSECDLVVWGSGLRDQFDSFRMTLTTTGTEVLRAEDVARELEIDLGPRESSAGPVLEDSGATEDGDVSEDEPVKDEAVEVEAPEPAPRSGSTETPHRNWEDLEEDLAGDLDVIMAQDKSFPDRLQSIGELLRNAIDADFAHVFVKDPVSRRLELASPFRGMTTSADRYQPMDRGIFGWIVRQGKSRLMTVGDPGSEQEQAVACLTLKTGRPDALIVLENFSISSGDRNRVQAFLESFVEQVEDIFAMEQGVETQDILSGFRMRIADRASQLEGLPDQHRIQPTLEFANTVLASEVAYWIPERGARAFIAQPQTQQAARIVADAWDVLAGICEWVRENGSAVWSPSMDDSPAPPAPAPYVGVRERNGNGVLLVMYSPDEKGGPSDQLPQHLLTEILLGICDVLRWDVNAARSLERNPSREAASGGVWTDKILTRRELEQRVHEEQARTQRSGQSFSLVRFGFIQDADVTEKDLEFLAEFLFRNKRAVDFVGEVGAGAFIILSPNTDPEAEGLRSRFEKCWERQNPPHYLAIERCFASPREEGGFRFITEREIGEEEAA